MDKSSDEALGNQPTAETQRNHKPAGSSEERTFMGQPWGLANLFGIEMWERFSFYGMQAILAFYMYHETTQGGLGLDKGAATSIVGAYGGLVYMAALVASLVADRILGSERTLFYSAILVMIGHISLAFIPGVIGLAIGLVSIAIGSGGVKTNAQVVLGQLYAKDDPRRDAGFSIFYMGVNIGALFGPLLTGWIWGMKGFHWGFGLAAIGMAAGLVQYILMRKSTIAEAGHEIPNPLPKKQYPVWIGIAVIITVVSVTLVSTGIVPVTSLSTVVTVIALIAAVVLWWQMYSSPLTTKSEKTRLVGFIPMFVSGVLFFGIFQQQFTVLAIYSDIRLDREIFGWEMSPAWINSINPIFIIAFSMVFAAAWSKLGDRQWSTPVKFGVANIIIGISLFFFIPFSGGGENSTPLYAIIWILFLFTMGELMLSPVGNALATKVAPAAFPSRMMAVWLMAIAMGTSLAGTLAGFYNYEDAAAENTFFITLGIASVVLGLILLALRKWIVKEFVDVR
ncbi:MULTISPECIES: peptide MFS transporter [Corynebacterium]|uniref:Peptide MFS transporter n=1 Tax=Corynebacterium amycolatum TaxID=43765 RepID=A0AB38XWX4_CORAY|nr:MULTISPECIES: peptide MFS transporter [Corynebacterium]AIN82509.1 amino acid/peptide transporter family protein [Corynebacterium sp. ATCC 6931]KAA9268725.1 peptide MFS transporter [Corynebacterium amycolatum]KAA9288165.1 peptide MFS transporter [Corynebacterium amycolatum]MBC6725797.1 peptide MFS transporter [Corynebacterium amycolatum]MBU5624261.1 peptide MFS transporter [Corynebacterium amycolatum]